MVGQTQDVRQALAEPVLVVHPVDSPQQQGTDPPQHLPKQHIPHSAGGAMGATPPDAAPHLGVGQRVRLHTSHPGQVRCGRGMCVLAWVGRVGWCGKAVVYASIGGLACQAASSPLGEAPQAASISPQGAFTLLGTTGSHGVSVVLLLVMAACLLMYIAWRFGEAATGQGYDALFSSKKNFFKYRISPAVSGIVYVTYLIFICRMIALQSDPASRHWAPQQQAAAAGDNPRSWPSSWRFSPGGRAGLAVIGLAFLIATAIQLQGVFTRAWHRDYRQDLPRWLAATVFGIGHIGFLGRGAAFLTMAVLFFKDASGVDAPHERSMVANALEQLNVNGLRALLFIVGVLLIVYGLFAVLSSVVRVFPTPAPSRQIPVPLEELAPQEVLQLTEKHSSSRRRCSCCRAVCRWPSIWLASFFTCCSRRPGRDPDKRHLQELAAQANGQLAVRVPQAADHDKDGIVQGAATPTLPLSSSAASLVEGPAHINGGVISVHLPWSSAYQAGDTADSRHLYNRQLLQQQQHFGTGGQQQQQQAQEPVVVVVGSPAAGHPVDRQHNPAAAGPAGGVHPGGGAVAVRSMYQVVDKNRIVNVV